MSNGREQMRGLASSTIQSLCRRTHLPEDIKGQYLTESKKVIGSLTLVNKQAGECMDSSITTSGKQRRCGNPSRHHTRLTNALVLLVLLVAIPAARAQTARGNDINLRRLSEAVNAISQGDLRAAETLLKSVIAESPRDADALNLLGVIRAQEQNTVEAERLFRLARAAAPAHVGVQLNLGKLLLTMNRTAETRIQIALV